MKQCTLIARMSESQYRRLEAFQRRVCAPTVSAAARIAIERGMVGAFDALEQGTVGDDGQTQLLRRDDP